MTQSPWLFSGTIKENIIFHEKFDNERYRLILKFCCIEEDLNLFYLGDETLVEANGSNLSGGQKKRISLARCLYRNADLYLLDDPLAEIDLPTKHKILKNINSDEYNILDTKVFFLIYQSILFLISILKTVIILTTDNFIAKNSTSVFEIQNGSVKKLESFAIDDDDSHLEEADRIEGVVEGPIDRSVVKPVSSFKHISSNLQSLVEYQNVFSFCY